MTESDFQKVVINLAKMHGWLVHHPMPAMNKRGVWATHELGDHGFPDLVLAHPSGRVIFAELKSDKGKISPTGCTHSVPLHYLADYVDGSLRRFA